MSLDVAIKKSLFDKDVESFVYNPNIVINEHSKNIKEKIQELLKHSTRVDIAVSYVVWSGLSLIYDDLKKFGSDSRLLLTTEGMVTDPRSLKKLKELNMKTKVYVPNSDSKGFHLKTYMFENGDNRTLLIGSSNISARAFGMVHEMAVEIDANKKGYIVEKYNNVFCELWHNNCSEELTDTFIESYTDIYRQKKKIDSNFATIFLNTNDIKPNYMQEKALISLEECRQISDRGLVIAATGTGKTYLSAFDVKNSKAKKVLFLVHNRLILTSAIKTYKKVFNNRSIIELSSSNIEKVYSSDIVFTTDKTAFTYLIDKLPQAYFDYIIYDEAHKIGLETKYKDLINYFTPNFTLGLTATPERTDNPEYLFKVFQYSIPYEIRLLEAMNNELICPFMYYGLNLDEKLLKADEKFNYEELAKYLRSIIEEKGHYGEKLKCLIFCSNIKEANVLSIELNKIGFKSVAAVSGQTSFNRSQIEECISDLKSNVMGTLEIICTVNKFNEGIDIPDINTIIMLRNTTSSIIYIQQLGRGLRRTEDPHKYVAVFDIIGNSKNNYTIAQVLTGNTTVDKRKLYMYANKEFKTVSPFINVEIQKEAMDKIIKSISNNFTVKTKLKEKFKNELYRFKEIPTLKEMYLNPNFQEIELLQLLFKNFYEPFEDYYYKKYNIQKGSKFINGLLTLITQFVFRAYENETLKDYVQLLKGKKINNDILRRVLLPSEFEDGISTAINSEYNKKVKNFPKAFLYKSDKLYLNPKIMELLNENNALELYKEHIELFEYLSINKNYRMQIFDLVDKGEFLYNVGSKDCYMNVVGERIDKDKKVVYCTIKITEKESFYDNYIVDDDKIVYFTQGSKTKEAAQRKIEMFQSENYKFYICAQFPHLGYSNTAYFNLGNVKINSISEVKLTEKGKYNHEIEFQLEKRIPVELLQYKEI
ncbi:MAG TPA: DEAD/DEAH box helicase family protein [Tenericutes bacterium]|mgnify:CR=1 FL=1|nr:DEAD/DEAH box helicase family protein [Mycoplasmatota bacterium]